MKKLFLIWTVAFGSTVAHGQCSITFQVNHATCFGDCNGSATALVTGGTSPYTYLWTPTSQTTQTASGLCAGTYTCVVTDANSNTCSATTTVFQPAPLVAVAQPIPASCPTCCDGCVGAASTTGGTPPYTYFWLGTGCGSGPMTTCCGICPGTYTLCVTDAQGCNSCTGYTITSPPTGIQESNQTISLSIAPNPFSSQTILQTVVPLKNATLTVDNIFGQTVAQVKNISGQTITFNRDNLPSGLYFVRLTEENKTIAVDKLVINDK